MAVAFAAPLACMLVAICATSAWRKDVAMRRSRVTRPACAEIRAGPPCAERAAWPAARPSAGSGH